MSRKQTAKISTKLYDLIHNEKCIGHTDKCGFWTVESGQGDCQKSEPFWFIVQTYRITFTLKNKLSNFHDYHGKFDTNSLWAYYRPPTELRQGNVSTGVCQSFCSRGVSGPMSFPGVGVSLVPGPFWGRYVQECGYDWGAVCQGDEYPWDTMGYGPQVGSTHRTGMLSCCEGLAHYLTDKNFLSPLCVHES